MQQEGEKAGRFFDGRAQAHFETSRRPPFHWDSDRSQRRGTVSPTLPAPKNLRLAALPPSVQIRLLSPQRRSRDLCKSERAGLGFEIAERARDAIERAVVGVPERLG
jgi:hypothetical protein